MAGVGDSSVKCKGFRIMSPFFLFLSHMKLSTYSMSVLTFIYPIIRDLLVPLCTSIPTLPVHIMKMEFCTPRVTIP